MHAVRTILIFACLLWESTLLAALVNCPECQRQVSDSATQCPGCGLPGYRLRPRPVNPTAPREFRPPVRQENAWADTVENGFTASPFVWTAVGATLTEGPDGLQATPVAAAADAQLHLRVRAPSARGRMVIQFLGRTRSDLVQLQYGTERGTAPPSYWNQSESSGGRSSNLHFSTDPGETPVVRFLVPAGGLTIERVRVFWSPDQGDGFMSSLNPSPLTPAPKSKAVTVAAVRDAVLTVQTDGGSGTAFLARNGSEVLVYTTQRVLSGMKAFTFRNAAGKSFAPVSMEIAGKEDLVRLALNAESVLTAGEALRFATVDPRDGDRVSAYVSGPGAGSLMELSGQVVSVVPPSFEVSIMFGESSGGAPVCNERGEVIGLASFVRRATDAGWVSPDSPFARNQRLVHRITPSVAWTKVQPQAFLAQARAAEESLRFLGILATSLERLRLVPSTTEIQTPYLDLAFMKAETEKARLETRWSQQLGLFAQRFAMVEGKTDRRLNPGEVQRHLTNLRQEYTRLADLAAGEAGKTKWMSGYLQERAAQATALAGAIRTQVGISLDAKQLSQPRYP